MPRLIDADALVSWLDIVPLENGLIDPDKIKQYISEMPDANGGWVSVKDRLPEQVKTVLVARKYVQPCHKERRYVETAELIGTSWVSIEDEYKMHLQFHTLPYAWMPMPEPPKEEHDEP